MLFGILLSCTEKNPEEPADDNTGKIAFSFRHQINGVQVQFDTLLYVNSAGNSYLINEIQYFISDVTLYYEDGTSRMIKDWEDSHYVDTDLPYSHTWEVYDKIPVGEYDSISFTFGFKPEKNISFMFVNPPENNMFWPEYMGGGYHYMKLNGKWVTDHQTQQTTPFDFHLGIGQVYNSQDSIIGFIHNNFNVSLPHSNFSIKKGETSEISIIMNVENWFDKPHVYDHDVWGGYIMQNQEAMQRVKENGWNVFTMELTN
ncbi:MAG: MbnP family protein [Bacteroidales bacterium]